jgi:hypothetical protein
MSAINFRSVSIDVAAVTRELGFGEIRSENYREEIALLVLASVMALAKGKTPDEKTARRFSRQASAEVRTTILAAFPADVTKAYLAMGQLEQVARAKAPVGHESGFASDEFKALHSALNIFKVRWSDGLKFYLRYINGDEAVAAFYIGDLTYAEAARDDVKAEGTDETTPDEETEPAEVTDIRAKVSQMILTAVRHGLKNGLTVEDMAGIMAEVAKSATVEA